MGQLVIRNLDDAVIRLHKEKAELAGLSLEQHLRETLARTAPYTPEERVAVIKRLHAMTPKGVPQTDSWILIREDRDSR